MSFAVRAGAIAAATLSFIVLLGTTGSDARAEIQAPALIQPADPSTTEDSTLPRFVAEPVVQPLPAEYGETDEAASLADLVQQMPDVELSGDLKCLAQAIYFEARGEPLDGQLAVAEVIINRTQSHLYPADYCSVVAQPAQFSFVRRGSIPQPNRSSAAWARAKAVAQIAHQDLWDSGAEGALYFHSTRVKPQWARRKTAVARIDTHVFYR
ncbi:MAG TPA: cell wall hydrolase [Croceibacterium sp.]|nr:cell wall hydrolase [Croceibacterium sp.]